MADILRQALLIEERQYCVFWDPTYILQPWLQMAFNWDFASEDQLAFNKSMSSVHVTVEWSYKDL